MADDAVYWRVLESVERALRDVPDLVPYRLDIRPAPTYVRDEDGTQITLVCPRRETWEKFVDLQFGGTAFYGYPVLVALIAANAFDRAQFRWQVNARAAIRSALFVPTWTIASEVFDVEYDPSPASVGLAAFAPPVSVSLQMFTYTAQETR